MKKNWKPILGIFVVFIGLITLPFIYDKVDEQIFNWIIQIYIACVFLLACLFLIFKN